jgi:sporulation integral membrane protein YlbJ
MQHSTARNPLSTAILGLAAMVVVLGIITFPDASFHASLKGLTVWWEIVFPALLPYFILSEMMLAQGVVHWFGSWLEPLMRTLFRLPGVSGWAIAIGWSAGSPAGAEVTAKLRKQGQLNQHEGETLLALSSLCNPIFLISVVSVGFFGQAQLALFLVVIHYSSALLVGLIWAWGSNSPRPAQKKSSREKQMSASLWIRSYRAMDQARQEDGRSLGKLLGDSVSTSIQALMMIGGFMMIFSVLIQLLELIVWPDTLTLWLTGIMELNLGAYAMSQTNSGASIWNVSFLCALLGFSGLSIHAQVKSFIRGTDLRYASFFAMKIQHALLSFGLAFVCWKPYQQWMISSKAVFQPLNTGTTVSNESAHWIAIIPQFGYFILPALLVILLALSMMTRLSLALMRR